MKRALGPLLVAASAHGALLLITIHLDPVEAPPEVVRVRLPKPPEPKPEPPPPEPEPPPPEPEPPPPEPIPPEAPPKPPPPEPPPEPSPRPRPKPAPEDPRASRPPPPESPAPEAPPPVKPPPVKPPPQPQAKPPPSPTPSPKPDMRAFGRGVHGSVKREKRYPVAARRLGLEGRCTVRLTINKHGALVGAPKIVRSTGHTVLDDEALRMVQRAAPFAPLPAGFGKPTMTIVIPLDFKLRGS